MKGPPLPQDGFTARYRGKERVRPEQAEGEHRHRAKEADKPTGTDPGRPRHRHDHTKPHDRSEWIEYKGHHESERDDDPKLDGRVAPFEPRIAWATISADQLGARPIGFSWTR